MSKHPLKRTLGSGATIVGAALLCATAPARAADTVIDLSYDAVMDMVRPVNHPGISLHRNFEVTLSPGGKVRETRNRTARRYSDANAMTQSLGSDGGAFASWRVLAKDQLVRIEHDPQNTKTMTVTLTSPTSCRLDIKDELKPGFSEYAFLRISTHEIGYFSSYRIVNTSCAIR